MKALWIALLAVGVPLLLVFALMTHTGRVEPLVAERTQTASPRPPAVAPATMPARAPRTRPAVTLSPTSRPSVAQVLTVLDELLNAWDGGDPPVIDAGQYLTSRDYPRALTAFDRLLVRRANDPALLLGKGMALAGMGRHEDALPLFENAVERDPASAAARFNLSVTLTRLGQLEPPYSLCGPCCSGTPITPAAASIWPRCFRPRSSTAMRCRSGVS